MNKVTCIVSCTYFYFIQKPIIETKFDDFGILTYMQ